MRTFSLKRAYKIFFGVMVLKIFLCSATWAMDNNNTQLGSLLQVLNEANDGPLKHDPNLLASFKEKIGPLNKYIVGSGLFCHNIHSYLNSLNSQLQNIDHLNEALNKTINILVTNEEIPAQGFDKSWVREFFAANFTGSSNLLDPEKHPFLNQGYEYVLKVGNKLTRASAQGEKLSEEKIQQIVNKQISKKDIVLNNTKDNIRKNIGTAQLRQSAFLWVQSAYYIYLDYKQLESIKENITNNLALINESLEENGNIKERITTEIEKELQSIGEKVDFFIVNGGAKLKNFIVVAESKDGDECIQFIRINLPVFINSNRKNKNAIESELSKLGERVDQITKDLDKNLSSCCSDKDKCETITLGQIILAGANLYGAFSTGGVSTLIHGFSVCSSIYLSFDSYKKYNILTEQLFDLQKILRRYQGLQKTCQQEEERLITKLNTFMDELDDVLNDDRNNQRNYNWNQ